MRTLTFACQNAVVAMVFAISPVSAVAQNRVPIYLSASSSEDDQIGRQLIFEVKEAVRGSASFSFLDDTKIWPRINVMMVTTRISQASTAASYAFTYDSIDMPLSGAYIVSSVQVCGRDQVRGCARDILSHIDAALDQLKTKAPELRKTLQVK
jgi:hypothetical protein